MEKLVVKINTLDDAKKGIPVIEGMTRENCNECKDITAVLLEGGTQSGATSLMIVLKDDSGKFHIGEMTSKHLEGLAAAYKGAVERFGK